MSKVQRAKTRCLERSENAQDTLVVGRCADVWERSLLVLPVELEHPLDGGGQLAKVRGVKVDLGEECNVSFVFRASGKRILLTS